MPPINPNSVAPSPLANMLTPSTPPAPAAAATPAAPIAPALPVEMFTMDDVEYLRGSIFDKVKDATIKRFPVENSRYILGLSNVRYSGAKEFTKKEQKDALLKRKNLTRALKGTWTLTDKETGQVIDRAENKTVAQVPYLTERGTFVRNGNEYTVSNQSRLRAGAYNRRRASGELETHFNVLEGGRPFRVVFDPQTEKLTMQVGGAKLDLATVLKGLGKSESELRKAWGDEIYVKNSKVDTSMTRAMKQFGASRKENEGLSLNQIFAKMKLDPEITLATLKKGHEFVDTDTIMAATRRLLSIARKEEEEDDRDSIAFQKIMGPDDLFSERIALDYDRMIQGRLLWNSTRKGMLSVESGALTKLLDTVFTKSGLSQPLEEVNPIETLDQAFKLVRTGEGGISGDGVPMESRNVQGTHFGIIDPVRGPESGKIGLDSRFAINVRRGSDGRIYTMLNNRAGKLVPVSAKDAANSIIAFPGELASGDDKVRAMVRGKISYVDTKDVTYEMKDPSHMFTVGSNLVPMISSTIGSRLLMGAKFYNQALPVRNPEAPYVQGLSDDGDTTFENIYGGKTGVIRADVPGRVIKVTKDSIHVNTRNGVVKHDLYDNFPFNRKTYLSNIPQVQMGDHVSPGQVLASTNFTNAKGTLALGKNLRTAYLSWRGANFEDAVVISQGASDKMSSEHLFSHKVDNETHTQRGKKEYLSLYPGTYTKDQYSRLDEDGVIRPGQTVSKGDPLILAVRQKPLTDIHRGHKPGWMDAAEEWEREADGLVTDVEKTSKGVRISIRSFEPMKVGDKIVGRFGDKGVIADIVPDDVMPHGEDGKPYEVLLNPLTVVSRTNPSQVIETALGKIAAKTGKIEKMPGFMKGSVIEYAIRRLKEAGLSDTENLSDPSSNRKFKDTLTGSRFFMKLHHMSEDKADARNVGGYTSEDTPARGGHGGGKQMGTMDINALLSHGACFLGATNVLTEDGWLEISKIVKDRMDIKVASIDGRTGALEYKQVIDWFCRSVPESELMKITTTARGGKVNKGIRGAHRAIRCTRGHEFLVPEGKIQAAHLKVGDTLLTPGTYVEPWQYQMMLGMLMGDGYIGGRRRQGGAAGLAVCHGHKQMWYLRWKYELLSNFGVSKPKEQKLSKGGFTKKPTSRFTLRIHPIFDELRKMFYPVDKKIVPKGIVKMMGLRGIALWFGDDGGCLQKTDKKNKATAFRLHTNGFTVGDVERLAEEMREFTGLNWSFYMQNGKYPILTLAKGGREGDQLQKWAELMAPYLPEEFNYKLGNWAQATGAAWDGLEAPKGEFAEPCYVKTVGPYKLAPHEGSVVYNITVKDNHSYIVHGVAVGNTEVLKDAKTIRGQKNTEFWKAFQMGRTPPSPEVPMIYKKFLSHLRGAGINLKKSGGQLHIMALTDADVDKMSAGAITEARGVDLATLKEVPGGLFDKRLTGGHDGDKWSHIDLDEPIPNPVMEEPIRRMLGITQGKLEDILSGKETLNGRTGGTAILEALRRLKIPEMHRATQEEIRSGAKSRRDDAIKLMGYIKMMEKTKIHPRDFMMTKVPVIPPKFRPISSTEKFTIVADANKLYVDLLKTNEALKEVKEELGTESAGDERLALYNSFKAVTGLGDPLSPKLKSQRVRGLLGHVFGRSPKMGMFQRRVLGGSMDFSGRAVISPNPSLDMDHVGLPEDKAWDLYQPFIMRKLTRAGMAPTAAVLAIKNRSKSAKDALMSEMDTRPILINRAPTLHRYNIMAAYPTLVKGNTLQVSPAVTSGFNADFDGDAMQFHVPISDKAVQQAKEKMLPSKNLFAVGGFNVHYLPTMEYQYGLYLASSKKSKREPTVFVNKEAAIAAYRRGEIDAEDRVIIR